MTEAIRSNYEVSSQGSGHWDVSYARMTDVTPTPTQPAQLTCLLVGGNVCGTVLSIDANVSRAVVDVNSGMVYLQEVRDVLTYSGAVENTWGAINEGDIIYYDVSATMPAGVKLSTSPLDNTGAANARFGIAVYSGRVTYPLGGITGSTVEIPVMQRGAGA